MKEERSVDPGIELTSDDPRVRRRALRRVVAIAVAVWLAFLWLHQVLDGPGEPVSVDAIESFQDADAERAEIVAQYGGYAGERTRVFGAVRSPDGSTAADVLVAVTASDEFFWTRTDALGTFALEGVPVGRAWLAIVPLAAPGLDLDVALPHDEPFELELPGAFPPIETLPEIRRAPLEGTLEVPFDRSPAGYEIALLPLELTSRGARPIAAPGLDGRVERRVRVDASGRFRLEDTALGAYQLRVLPPYAAGSNWPVVGTATFAHDGDGALAEVDATSGAILGVAVDESGRPVAGALVTVTSASDPTSILPPTETDAEGAFVVEDVPEASLRVRVRAGSLSAERIVRIAPLRRERVELRLAPSAGR
ncbi:MAG: carboxypeptidase regulatory-like domain-containing protein [Planctomycetota bacterium]